MAQACQRHDKAHRLREEVSCMLIGDGAVGKTSMIISYIFNGYNSEYRQTAFDVFTGECRFFLFKGDWLLHRANKLISTWLSGLVHVNGVPTRVKLIDTAGQVEIPRHHNCNFSSWTVPSDLSLRLFWQEEFGHLRSLCYAHVDVFILCFSLVNPASFENVTSKWIPQIRAGNQTSPILLVGTQSDLRHDVDVLIHLDQRSTKPVHFSQARRLAHRIRAHGYVECSALTQHNLKDVFDRAIFAAIKHKHAGTNCKKLSLLKRLKTFCDCGWRKIIRFIWCGVKRWIDCVQAGGLGLFRDFQDKCCIFIVHCTKTRSFNLTENLISILYHYVTIFIQTSAQEGYILLFFIFSFLGFIASFVVHIFMCVLRFCNKCTTVLHIFNGQLLCFLQISTLMQTAGENYSVDPTVEGTVSEEMEGKHKVPFGTNGHLLMLWSATLQDKSRLNPPCVWNPVLRHVSNNYLQNSHPHGIFFSEIMIS